MRMRGCGLAFQEGGSGERANESASGHSREQFIGQKAEMNDASERRRERAGGYRE